MTAICVAKGNILWEKNTKNKKNEQAVRVCAGGACVCVGIMHRNEKEKKKKIEGLLPGKT